jgi:hypothetical protein
MLTLKLTCVTALALILTACTALEQLRGFVQAPKFQQAAGQEPELRLLAPGPGRPIGGAGLRLLVRATNPNPFGFTLTTLRGTLFLEESRAAVVDFPLGLPIAAGGETTFPLDLTIDFNDIPALASTIRRVAGRQPIAYRLDGTIGAQAGRFGTPTFGPMTLLSGDVR